MPTSGLSNFTRGLFISGALLGGALASNTSSAASFDINLSNDSAQVRYATVIGGSTLGRTETSASLLYTDSEKYVADLGLLVIDVAGSKSPGLELGVGPKFYYADGDNGTAVAIGLGGQLRYKIPGLQRVNFGMDAYYAPNIVAFADASSMYEFGLRAGYEILPTADAYIGYRRIHADFDAGNETLDEAIIFGLKVSF